MHSRDIGLQYFKKFLSSFFGINVIIAWFFVFGVIFMSNNVLSNVVWRSYFIDFIYVLVISRTRFRVNPHSIVV